LWRLKMKAVGFERRRLSYCLLSFVADRRRFI